MIIYKVTNLINNKIYIGQTSYDLITRRIRHEKDALRKDRPTVYFHNALIKYGFKNFKWEIVNQYENQEDLDNAEKYYIQFYKSYDEQYGYNLKLGGREGGIFTEQAKINLGKTTKLKWQNPEIAERMRNGLKKATQKWIEICKNRRVKHVCPICHKEFYTAKHYKKIYCSNECFRKSVKHCLKGLEIANKVNKQKYEKYKEIKIAQIIEWVKENSHLLVNVKLNNLSFLNSLCKYLEIKDCRTVAKILDVSNRKDLYKKLVELMKIYAEQV